MSRRDGPPPSGWRTLVEAEWTLVKAGEKAIPGLLQALDDPEPQVRRLAAHSLGRIGEQSEVPALAAALADEAELSVRLSIASSLGLLGGSGSEQALRGVLALEPVPGGFHDVRREVEDSLRYARKVDRTRLKHEYEIATAELIDSVAIGKPVPDLSVLRADGAEVRLSELWSEENLVLVFLFAEFCMYCKGQVDDLASHAEKMHGAGARVAMVVPQVPERVRPWKERTGSATTFLCDPAGRLQALFGVAHQIHLHEQWFPSPSCAIVDREGILRFFYRGKSYNDRFNASRVIEALERLH